MYKDDSNIIYSGAYDFIEIDRLTEDPDADEFPVWIDADSFE